MKKTMLLAAVIACGSMFASAQLREAGDTLQLQEVEVLVV